MGNDELLKGLIIETLDKWKSDLINNRCTPTEIKSLANMMLENVEADATLDEIAQHFGQSKSNVSNIIARRFLGRPKRVVVYPFQKILKIVPHSWFKRNNK